MANRKKVTALYIYNELIENFKIKEKIGSVEIKLGDITAKYNEKMPLAICSKNGLQNG